jgi:hypothetical protein
MALNNNIESEAVVGSGTYHAQKKASFRSFEYYMTREREREKEREKERRVSLSMSIDQSIYPPTYLSDSIYCSLTRVIRLLLCVFGGSG